ncbi:MAG TPA: FG-GAP-like repeat-containing protein [Polyangiaceae bacterium]|nr:FG-GAP-like repeat-containing protein [Polyangiaceae bacterium]
MKLEYVWRRGLLLRGEISLLVLGSACALGCAVGAENASNGMEETAEVTDEVIWNNSLLEYYQLTTSQKALSNASAAIVFKSDVQNCNTSFCTLRTVSGRMCSGQRFASQAAFPSGCTGFMVGPRQIATAGHCFDATALGSCSAASVVFRWRKDSSGTNPNPNILLEHIYNCASIVRDGRPEGEDWIVFEVDRNITSSTSTPRAPLPLAKGPTTIGALVNVASHFAGLATKWNTDVISDLPSAASPLIRAKVDLTGGSSGAPWIDATNSVMGVFSRGPSEAAEPPANACIMEKNCFNPSGTCTLQTDRPGATPGWRVAKGPRAFATLTAWIQPSGIPLLGDFNGDRKSDIFWFGSGATADVVWQGDGAGNFSTHPVSINTTNVPVVGDFDGDGRSDIFWYGSGATADFVWFGNANFTFTQVAQTQSGIGLVPVAGNFDGDTRSDLFWYGPGATADSTWYGNTNRTFTQIARTQAASGLTPATGDFDGDGVGDVFWFGPGTAADSVWYGSAARAFSVVSQTASLTSVTPVVGDYDGDSKSDIVWKAAGGTAPAYWSGRANRTFGAVTSGIPATPSAALPSRDYNNDDLDDLILFDGSVVSVVRGTTWSG